MKFRSSFTENLWFNFVSYEQHPSCLIMAIDWETEGWEDWSSALIADRVTSRSDQCRNTSTIRSGTNVQSRTSPGVEPLFPHVIQWNEFYEEKRIEQTMPPSKRYPSSCVATKRVESPSDG